MIDRIDPKLFVTDVPGVGREAVDKVPATVVSHGDSSSAFERLAPSESASGM